MEPVHREVRGNPFLPGGHGAPPLLADAGEEVSAAGEPGRFEEGGKLRFAGLREAPPELDVQLFRARLDQGEGGFLSLVRLVGGVGRGQAAEVGAEVGEPRQQLLGAGEDRGPGIGVASVERGE